jgi:hypothetical protein
MNILMVPDVWRRQSVIASRISPNTWQHIFPPLEKEPCRMFLFHSCLGINHWRVFVTNLVKTASTYVPKIVRKFTTSSLMFRHENRTNHLDFYGTSTCISWLWVMKGMRNFTMFWRTVYFIPGKIRVIFIKYSTSSLPHSWSSTGERLRRMVNLDQWLDRCIQTPEYYWSSASPTVATSTYTTRGSEKPHLQQRQVLVDPFCQRISNTSVSPTLIDRA